MKDINLELIYKDEYLDLEQDGGYLSRFIWMQLEYWRDGKTIIIKPFKIDELAMLSDLEYFDTHFKKHCERVEDFFEFINEQLEALSKMDYDEEHYKELAKENWDTMDEDEKEEYDDFENYWDEYSSSQSFLEMVAEDQSMQWEALRNEFEEEFKLMDKSMGNRDDYFDSYGNVLIDFAEKFNEEVEDIINGVNEFKESMHNANNMDNSERTRFFNELFF